jgi:hypothetical protein
MFPDVHPVSVRARQDTPAVSAVFPGEKYSRRRVTPGRESISEAFFSAARVKPACGALFFRLGLVFPRDIARCCRKPVSNGVARIETVREASGWLWNSLQARPPERAKVGRKPND